MTGESLQHSRYTDEEREVALGVAAFFSGNTRRAVAALRQDGLRVSRTTLRRWIKDDPDAYLAAQRNREPFKRSWVADRYERIVDASMDLQERASGCDSL